MNWQNKKILVLGLGKTGLSMLTFLSQQGADVAGFDHHLDDDRRSELAQLYPHISFYSGHLQEVLHYEPFAVLAISPGVSSKLKEIVAFKNKGGLVIGDIGILSHLLKGGREKIIAITGSNGKSTVTELVGFLCQQCGLNTVVAGNIGLPVLDAYQQQHATDVWVLELSSFQLDTTDDLCADVAVCLNISEDHLDRYDDLLDYAHSKDRVFQGADIQVLNADDFFCKAMDRPTCQTKWFSLENKTDYYLEKKADDYVLMVEDTPLLSVRQLSLQGLHNAANVLAAMALCEAIGLPRQALIKALPLFVGLPHRVEKIGELNGISFINDSKGTNVGATYAALAGATAPVVLIAGGLGKGQDFSPLIGIIKQKVKAVFLIGQDAQLIAQAIEPSLVKIVLCESLEEATHRAYQEAKPDDWVLLSPACASMDMFANYAHRAQVFIESFKALQDGNR